MMWRKAHISIFLKALEIGLLMPINALTRGFAKAELGEFISAIDDYTKGDWTIKRMQHFSTIGVAYFNVQIMRGHCRLQRNTASWSKNSLMFENRALTRVAMEDFKNALDGYNKAIEVTNDDPGFIIWGSCEILPLDDHDGAITDYTKSHWSWGRQTLRYYDDRALSRKEKTLPGAGRFKRQSNYILLMAIRFTSADW